MSKLSLKNVLIWVVVAFVLYAIYKSPERSAGVVHDIWDVLAAGVRSIGDFFKAILGT